MKICHLTSLHPAKDNRILYKECTTLAQNGYDITLIAPDADDTIINGVKVTGFISSRGGRFTRMMSGMKRLYRKARAVNADVYHFHDPELMPLGFWLRLKGKKVVIDIHENTPASLLSKPYLKNKIVKYTISVLIDLTEKFFVNFYSLIITARPDISDRFKRHKPVTLRNFPLLPDYEDIPDIDIKKRGKAFIYVGGISLIRGIIQLIDAFEKVPDAELWLLGPFEDDNLRKKCENMKGWRKVRYLGIVQPYEIFKYIKKADAGIITFLPKPNHLTTLATKPFEYMACGLPMIMSDFKYWKDFFKDSSLYADPEDSDSISKAIQEMNDNEDLRLRMARKNLELAQNVYNWQSEREKLLDAYKSL